jgi:hypothetical protein
MPWTDIELIDPEYGLFVTNLMTFVSVANPRTLMNSIGCATGVATRICCPSHGQPAPDIGDEEIGAVQYA